MPQTPVDGGYAAGALVSVSCPTASFCVALDPNGYALTYNGSSWGTPTNIDSNNKGYGSLTSVSCPTVSFCAAVDGNGNASTYNGSSWSPFGGTIGKYGSLTSVSCPTVSFCAAVDTYGNVLTYNGSSWGTPTNIEGGYFTSVSCASASFCVAVKLNGNEFTSNGNVLTYNGSSWSAPATIDGTIALNSVSCPTASFCVAVDTSGNALTYNGSSWSAPASIDNGVLTSVSCPSASFCAAVDSTGNVVTYSGSPPSIFPRNTSLPIISGSAKVWKSLTCSQGSWSGAPAPTFAYQWRRDGVGIGGATGSTYVVQEADAAHALTCMVTATNSAGKESATSIAVNIPAGRPPSNGSCPDVVIYGARGSGEDNIASNVGMGPVAYQVAEEVRNRLPVSVRVGMVGVNYPAVPPWILPNYNWSVVTGAEVLVEGYNGQAGLVSLVLSCPKVAVVLVGLSQGAHVIHYTMSLAPTQPSGVTSSIAAILMFGDPVRQPNQIYNVGPQDAKGVLLGFPSLPGNSGPPDIVSYLQLAAYSYCIPNDPICDSSGLLEPAQLAALHQIHDGYGSSLYIAAAADLAVNRINGMIAHAATVAVRTGAHATVARASRTHRKHTSHKCVSRQVGLYEAISVCPHIVHGVRPQPRATYKGNSKDGDKISMNASSNAARVSVKVVDRCGAVFSGSIKVTKGGIFDGTTPGGFEITGLVTSKRIVKGTLTDQSCKNQPIRSFTLRRRGH